MMLCAEAAEQPHAAYRGNATSKDNAAGRIFSHELASIRIM
jgi:hypothetical protein